jgi:hypothetical protein
LELSSILTALKKLETNDSRENDLLILSKRGFSRRKKTPWNFKETSRFTLKALLVVSLTVLSFDLILRFRNQGDSKDIPGSVLPKGGNAETVQAERVDKEDNPSNSPWIGAGKEQPIGIRQGKNPPVNRVMNESSPLLVSKIKPPDQKAPDSTQAGQSGMVKATDDGNFFNSPRTGYPGWTLQAIAWAPDPKKRIAVINGSVLKEGDAFEGAYVSRIDENEVILLRKDDVLRLIFNLR